jgi:hypothetical protein
MVRACLLRQRTGLARTLLPLFESIQSLPGATPRPARLAGVGPPKPGREPGRTPAQTRADAQRRHTDALRCRLPATPSSGRRRLCRGLVAPARRHRPIRRCRCGRDRRRRHRRRGHEAAGPRLCAWSRPSDSQHGGGGAGAVGGVDCAGGLLPSRSPRPGRR